MDARRGRWRFVLQIFLLVKGNHLAVLLVTAVVTVLKELLERREQKRINLNVVTSALHPNTLAVPAGELVRQAGAQLQLDTRGIPHICHRHHRQCLWRKNWSCGEIPPMRVPLTVHKHDHDHTS